MSETSVNDQTPDITFYSETYPNQEILKQRLPQWFTRYRPETATLQMELYKSQLKSLAAQTEFAALIKSLKSVHEFARPLLNQKMLEQFKVRADCTQITLEEVISIAPLDVTRTSILSASLFNFDVDKVLNEGSVLRYTPPEAPPAVARFDNGVRDDICGAQISCSSGLVNVDPNAFARMCRSLDLGGQYQTHLDSVFKLTAIAGQIAEAFTLKERTRFEVLSHIARMKDDVSQEAYEVLLKVARNDDRPVWRGGPVFFNTFEILDQHLTGGFMGGVFQGVVMIESHAQVVWPASGPGAAPSLELLRFGEPGHDFPVVVYMPGDPAHPLKEYPTAWHFFVELLGRFTEPSLRNYFARFIRLQYRSLFLDKISAAAGSRDPLQDIWPRWMRQQGQPFQLLYDQAVSNIYADAEVLAVPVSEKTNVSTTGAWQIFKSVAHVGFDLADVFLPASEVRNLVEDAFIGVENWSDGETGKALGQLYTIGKDIVLAAVPKVAREVERLEKIYEDGKQALEYLQDLLEPSANNSDSSAAGQSRVDQDEIVELERNEVQLVPNSAKPSAFIESLVQVKSGPGSTRLWKPSLDSFERHGLPKGTFLNSRSLFTASSKTWLVMGDHCYEVGFDSALSKWRILNPDSAQPYSPVLETNDVGAWRFEGESPMGWDVYTAFRRLHGDLVLLADDTIRQILRVTEADEALLRQIHVDKLVPPALLIDCAQRFLLDHQVTEFIALMMEISTFDRNREGDDFFVRRIEPYLDFLVKLPGWPDDRVLRRLDGQGTILSIHAPTNNTARTIDVTYIPGKMTAFLDALVIGLSPEEVELLLVDYQGAQTRSQYLAMRIAFEAEGRRALLLESCHAAGNRSTDPLVRLVKRDFPSLPDCVAREIVSCADRTESRRMVTTGRIPLRIGELAREYLQHLRLNRALECFYLHIESADSATVALGLINSVPDWPQDAVFEVRNNTFDGERLFRSGGSDATQGDPPLVFVKSGADYEMFNDRGQRVHLDSKGLHDTLARALSDQASLTRDVSKLELALGDIATTQRSRVKRLLGMRQIKPGIKWPSRLADGRVGYPLSGRLRGLFDKFRSNAQAFSPQMAVKNLYPQFTPREVRKFLEKLSMTFTGTAHEKQNHVRARLNELAEQYTRLESALDSWLTEVKLAQPGQLPGATIDGREVARRLILSCWRREPASVINPAAQDWAHKLDLSGLAIGSLPVIEANFNHVHALTLENMALTADSVEVFLRRFPEARWLSLRGNLLDAVPATLARLSTLKRLVLSNNPISIDGEGMQYLQRLSALETLVLEGQSINIPVAIDVSRWPALVELKLRNCGLAIMPFGLGVYEPLRHVDLRHNWIADIDDAAFSSIASRANLYVRLHQNPLNEQTIARAERVFDPVRLVRMGIVSLPDLPGHGQPVAQWLAETGREEQRVRWSDLQLEAGGEAFVQLVNDMFLTADYRDNRRVLTSRLWRMIDAMANSYPLQEELFALAAHPQTCGDGAMIIFNQLDVRVLVHELESRQGGVSPVDMFRLIRGLERLSELEKIALEDFNSRVSDQPGLDQVEVRLIYPTLLRDALELPGQAQTMLFESISGVTQQMLDRARDRVLAREGTEEFFDSMIARKDWITFLEEHYPQRFERMNQPFHDRQDALDAARETLTDEAYLLGTNRLLQERQESVAILASLLTRQIAQSASVPD
ncbi:NEL-type E3 ubiquitin ligase domain-containing protein [Pseudomonas sp. DSP3-2-2]|uniref:NEL-type E3 ubiquitin ligase domain-containing protein n=1 Tax=unclassified Pseudomonas TaxID=196821 RepID=UPI003CF6E331